MKDRKKVIFYGLTTILIWATAFPLTKVSQDTFSPEVLGFIRCSVAAVFLLLIGKKTHIRPLQKSQVPIFLLGGFVGFSGYMIAFNTGLKTLLSSTSSVIIALTPILTAIAAYVLYREKISAVGWTTIGAAFVGVLVLLLWETGLSINIGAIWTLAASFLFCWYNILTRVLSARGFSALEIVTYCMLFGAIELIFALPTAVAQIQHAPIEDILAVIAMGLLPSATAYLSWGKAMTYAEKTSEVTNFLFLSPLMATILGFVLLDEVPNAGTFIGGGMIILSLVIFNTKGRAQSVKTSTLSQDKVSAK